MTTMSVLTRTIPQSLLIDTNTIKIGNIIGQGNYYLSILVLCEV